MKRFEVKMDLDTCMDCLHCLCIEAEDIYLCDSPGFKGGHDGDVKGGSPIPSWCPLPDVE